MILRIRITSFETFLTFIIGIVYLYKKKQMIALLFFIRLHIHIEFMFIRIIVRIFLPKVK